MAGFLYFVPDGKLPLGEADLRALGLGHALSGRGVMAAGVRAGPDGKPGVIVTVNVADARRQPACRYDASAQTWRAGPPGTDGQSAWWLGRLTADGPGPDDLRRDKLISGEVVRLLDGRDWTIPIARSISRGETLPRRLVLGTDFQSWDVEELPEFTAICADAALVWTAISEAAPNESGKMTVQMPAQDVPAIAARALGVNYRVGMVEIDALGLLTTANVWDILRALVDYSALLRMSSELQKKSPSGPEPSSTSDGGAVS